MPEILNSRMCMVAVPAAICAELAHHETIGAQFGEAAPLVLGFAALFTAATIIPVLEGAPRTASGSLTPAAELMNGRASPARRLSH